jgi:glucokinase
VDHTQGTDARPVIGVDMGGTKILAAVVRGDGKILGSAKKRTRAELGPDEVIVRISETVFQAAESADVSLTDVEGMGIGAPGPVDPHTGMVFHTPNMPGWNDVPLGQRLSDLLGIPVFVENDVNIGTLGEHVMGAGRGTKDMVGIFVGTGVGGGIILDGQLRGGARHAAGEIGHMVVAAGGPYCGCGRQGCLEAVASRTAIERDLRAGIQNGRENLLARIGERRLKRMTSGVLARAWAEGCPLTHEVLGRAQWYLGLHAAAIVNLLDPEMLVYGGGLIEALGDRFLEPVRAVARQHYIYQEGAPVQIVTAELGDEAAVLGAAVVAWRRTA